MTDRFLLKSVSVENFKAVRRSGTVKLTPLTVFIGNNGSGKSSLIEALETYRTIVLEGLDAAMERWHGMDHVLNRRSGHPRHSGSNGLKESVSRLKFRLKGCCHVGSFQVRLEAGIEAGGNRIRIEDESLEFPAVRGHWHRDESGRLEAHSEAPSLSLTHVGHRLPGESVAPPDWRSIVRRWQFLALNPHPMGEPAPQRRTGGPPMLNRDGSNLGQYLWSL